MALLGYIGASASPVDHSARVDAALEEIAGALDSCLNVEALATIAGL